jgi:hypothetical protein
MFFSAIFAPPSSHAYCNWVASYDQVWDLRFVGRDSHTPSDGPFRPSILAGQGVPALCLKKSPIFSPKEQKFLVIR